LPHNGTRTKYILIEVCFCSWF